MEFIQKNYGFITMGVIILLFIALISANVKHLNKTEVQNGQPNINQSR